MATAVACNTCVTESATADTAYTQLTKLQPPSQLFAASHCSWSCDALFQGLPFCKACPLQGLAFFKLTLLQSFAPCWSGPEVGVIVFKEVVPGEVGCSPWCLAPPAPHPIITPPLVTQPASPYPFPARLPPIGSLQVTATLHILPPPERGNL